MEVIDREYQELINGLIPARETSSSSFIYVVFDSSSNIDLFFKEENEEFDYALIHIDDIRTIPISRNGDEVCVASDDEDLINQCKALTNEFLKYYLLDTKNKEQNVKSSNDIFIFTGSWRDFFSWHKKSYFKNCKNVQIDNFEKIYITKNETNLNFYYDTYINLNFVKKTINKINCKNFLFRISSEFTRQVLLVVLYKYYFDKSYKVVFSGEKHKLFFEKNKIEKEDKQNNLCVLILDEYENRSEDCIHGKNKFNKIFILHNIKQPLIFHNSKSKKFIGNIISHNILFDRIVTYKEMLSIIKIYFLEQINNNQSLSSKLYFNKDFIKALVYIVSYFGWDKCIAEINRILSKQSSEFVFLTDLKREYIDLYLMNNKTSNLSVDLYNSFSLKSYIYGLEKHIILEALNLCQGNKVQASKMLSMKRTTLIEKLKKISK